MTPPSSAPPTVFVVDDDPGMLDSLLRLLKSEGLAARGFASARDFLAAWNCGQPGCLVADVWMADMTGVELQAELLARGAGLPMILMSARPLVPDVVQAMKSGAIDFLEKPFDDEALLARVRRALDLDARRWERAARLEAIDARLARLTARESEIMRHLAAGETTKEIAFQLGISSKTADIHRARIFEKLELPSVVEVLRLLHEREELAAVVSASGA